MHAIYVTILPHRRECRHSGDPVGIAWRPAQATQALIAIASTPKFREWQVNGWYVCRGTTVCTGTGGDVYAQLEATQNTAGPATQIGGVSLAGPEVNCVTIKGEGCALHVINPNTAPSISACSKKARPPSRNHRIKNSRVTPAAPMYRGSVLESS